MSISLIILAFIAVIYLLFPIRRHQVFDGQAQVISLYNEELAELDNALKQDEISQAEYQTLKAELEKKSSLAMLQTKKTTFAYRPSLLLPAVVFVLFIGCSVFYLMKFYSGKVATWDSFKASERGTIIEGLFNQALIEPFMEKENHQICFAMQQQALANYPNNPKVLGSLANCHLQSGYVQLAEEAAKRGLTHQPDDPDLNYYFAQSRLMLTGESNKEMVDALTKTIKANPNHQGALWLMGLISYQQGSYENADFFFTRLQSLSPNSPEIEQFLTEIRLRTAQTSPQNTQQDNDPNTNQVSEESDRQSEEQTTPSSAESDDNTIANDNDTTEANVVTRFEIKVDIDPELQESVSKTAALFIIIKSTEGGLLLAGKYPIANFPMNLTLTETDAGIMKMGDLADYNAFVVSARISQNGEAMPKAGDLQSVELIANKAATIAAELNISKVVGE